MKFVAMLMLSVSWLHSQTEEKAEVSRRVPVDGQLPAYRPAEKFSGQKFKIEGSGVMATILTPMAERFVAIHRETEIDLSYPSSAAVFDGLMEGRITFAAMSRALTEPEKLAFERKFERKLIEICIALDALEILVNRFNPVSGITIEQLDAIYSSAGLRGNAPVAVWGDLGMGGSWLNQPIEAYGGGTGWGTTRTFETLVSLGAESKSTVHQRNIETGIPAAVAKDISAIGYSCLGKRSAEVRSVPVAASNGSPYVACTAETLQNGSYPLRRPLYLYIVPEKNGNLLPVVRDFLLFSMSRDGQIVVSESGMVPLDAKQAAAERKILLGR